MNESNEVLVVDQLSTNSLKVIDVDSGREFRHLTDTVRFTDIPRYRIVAVNSDSTSKTVFDTYKLEKRLKVLERVALIKLEQMEKKQCEDKCYRYCHKNYNIRPCGCNVYKPKPCRWC
jgi:uncharacterized protein (UPF0248 family)